MPSSLHPSPLAVAPDLDLPHIIDSIKEEGPWIEIT